MTTPSGHWFEPVANHLGEAYLRYSFTRGTAQEVDAIADLVDLSPDSTVLDIGCGPGRHAIELARRGHRVLGLDISETFVDIARRRAADEDVADRCEFLVADARTFEPNRRFDLVVSLCQGAFGLTGGPTTDSGSVIESPARELDEPIMAVMAQALAADGRLVVSAFSSYFQLRHPAEGESFDADSGVSHEHTVVVDPDGRSMDTELWTTCYTPRELRLLARVVGLDPVAVHGVTPGRYRKDVPSTDCPEFLLVARHPISC